VQGAARAAHSSMTIWMRPRSAVKQSRYRTMLTWSSAASTATSFRACAAALG